MWWRWSTVVLLTMVPALLGGPSAGVAAGLAYGFDLPTLLVVVSVTSFVAGLMWIRLAELSLRIPRLRRTLERVQHPRAVALCNRWGPWGGLTLGAAIVGPEPILIVLKAMMISTRRLLLPLAVSSVAFTLLYYVIVAQGFAHGGALHEDLQLLYELWRD